MSLVLRETKGRRAMPSVDGQGSTDKDGSPKRQEERSGAESRGDFIPDRVDKGDL